MSKYHMRVGDEFGDWLVLDTRVNTHKRQRHCLCRCKCGKQCTVNYYNLVYGSSTGCGCLKNLKTATRNKTHGLSNTRAYTAWCSMWTRCTNKGVNCHKEYEARLPPECWRDFDVFYSEMGDCPPGLSLERKDNNKPYGPGNCTWATNEQQSLNRRNVIKVLLNGTVMSLKRACVTLGLTYSTIVSRVKRNGGDVEQATNNAVKLYTGGLYE